MAKRIRCAIYDRVSTEIQAENGLSLDTQKELLTDYATSHGYEIVDYYADEGITARKKLQNRKDFQRLMNDVRQDKVDLILVTKLDRWFRNVRDYHNTQAILEEHHCNWKTILEDYDTSTADGQLKINIMLAVAQNESDRTSERIKVVFEHKRRLGEHVNGRPPFGYMIVDKKLRKDPDKRAIVEDFFNQYFGTMSKRKAIEYVQITYGDRAPSPQAMDRFTRNEIYCGRRGTDLHYCEPYISPEQFRFIQETCSSRTYHSTNERYIFGQLMKCPYCGATMTGFVKKHKCSDGTISRYKRYRCSRKFDRHKTGICITESVIEDYMINHVNNELSRKIFEIKTGIPKISKADQAPRIRAEMDRLNNIYMKGRMSESEYDRQYEVLEKNLKKAEQERSESEEDYLHIAKTLSGNWLDIYLALDPEHKNAFWKKVIKEIVLSKETHKIDHIEFLSCGCGK